MDLDGLNAKFALPENALRITTGAGGLPCIDIATAACTARVYFHGAHITSWKPAGQERDVLWLSGKSAFEAGKAIRGGVPVCFPWFGPNAEHAEFPMHGFARLLPWELEATRLGDKGKAALVLLLKSSAETRKYLPYEFEVRHRITFGDQLISKLEVANTGAVPFSFEEALHTYFTLGEAPRVFITGCEAVAYIDKADGRKIKTQEGPVTFTGETDRVYLATKRTNHLYDPVLKRLVTIQKTDSEDTVIWNPWTAKAKALADFGDDEWKSMCCIETANVGEHRVSVASGSFHQVRVIISAGPLEPAANGTEMMPL